MRLGENVKQIVKISLQEVQVELESGKTLPCSTVMLRVALQILISWDWKRL